MAKIVQITQINFNDIVKMLKKKVLNGEIDIKYDESEDIIEVFDLDPGKKERVEKTKKFYEKIIEGNKNLFMSIQNNKLDELNGKTKNIKNDIAVNLIENEYFDQDMMMQEEFDE